MFLKRFIKLCSKVEKTQANGYSIIDLSIAITILGILASMIVPNFTRSLEFIEVLIAEKKLYDAVKECQQGLVNNEISPQYDLPNKEIGLGLFKNNKISFAFTGIEGECISYYEPNRIRLSRIDNNLDNYKYSLIINLITGERTSEGAVPEWLDWWEDFYSPLIPKNDPLIENYL